MSEIKKGILEDSDGDLSSKRVSGVICLSIAAAMGIGLYFASLFVVVKDPGTALDVIKVFAVTGGTLLGVGVFEGVFKR